MAVDRPGPAPSQDWPMLLAEYEAEYAPHKRTITEFAVERGLNNDTVARAFMRERERTAMNVIHARNKPLGIIAQRNVMRAVIDSENWPDRVRAANFNLAVLQAVLEREEPNPGLASNVAIVLPPMFPDSGLARAMMEALTGARFEKLKVIEQALTAEVPEEQVAEILAEEE